MVKMANLILYLILLVGSMAFGLEAMLVGFGGRFITLFRKRPWFTLGLATTTGLWVVMVSIVIGTLLALESIYIVAIVLLLTTAAGKIIAAMKPDLGKTSSVPLPKPISDGEIKRTLKKKGFKGLAKGRKK